MSSKDGAPVKYAIRNSFKGGSKPYKYAVRCFLRPIMRVLDVFFFGFSGVVERLLFMREKIGGVALYLSVSFSAPNKII